MFMATSPAAVDSSAKKLRWFLFAIALAVAITIAYSRVYHAGFIWDDEQHLTQNPVIVGPLSLADIWTSARAVYYPLVLTTFWVLHQFVGLNPLPYHLLNVALHIVSALLLWRVLAQLRVRGAWLGAAIWGLHPVLVQSVAWITELKNTQSTIFYLLSISLLLHSRRQRNSKLCYWLSLLSFAAAITSKPSTVILPAVLALCLCWRRGGLRWRDLRALIPFLAISLVASAWTIWEQKYHAHALGIEWAQTGLHRILVSADAIWFYLLKLLWPHPLIFIYPRWTIDASRPTAYLPLLLLVIAAVFLFLKRGAVLRPVFFALVYFIIALLPILDFFDVYFFRYSFVSDHFQYLASMGPLALAGAGIWTGCSRLRKLPRVAVSTAVLLLLGVLTFHQTANYRDAITLYRATLAANPRCWMADYNLAIALKDRGQLDDAIIHYRHAIATHPNYPEAHFNLARLLLENGRLDEALDHYRNAITLRPSDADTHNNYGSALRQSGRSADAMREYEVALRLDPNYLDARLNLATLLFQTGQISEAIAQWEEAKRIQPNDGTVHAELGNALIKAKRVPEAIGELEKAAQLAPGDVDAINSLAWLLATAADPALRDGTRALAMAERADKITSHTDPVVLHTLAAAYAEAGRFDDAVATARRGMHLASEKKNRLVFEALRDELPLYELGLPYHQATVR